MDQAAIFQSQRNDGKSKISPHVFPFLLSLNLVIFQLLIFDKTTVNLGYLEAKRNVKK